MQEETLSNGWLSCSVWPQRSSPREPLPSNCRADGKLIFAKWIRDTLVDTPGAVVAASVTDYAGLTTDVDYDRSSVGFHVPDQATRSGDGVLITYSFVQDPIHETEDSKLFYAETDAEEFAVLGSMTISVATGESTTITVATAA